MCDIFTLLLHAIVIIVRLVRPGGLRSVAAESVLMRHQVLILNRGAAVAAYDVTADGQTFVMTRSERDNPTEIRIVIGWPNSKPAQK